MSGVFSTNFSLMNNQTKTLVFDQLFFGNLKKPPQIFDQEAGEKMF